jgi:hypothetical protein
MLQDDVALQSGSFTGCTAIQTLALLSYAKFYKSVFLKGKNKRLPQLSIALLAVLCLK